MYKASVFQNLLLGYKQSFLMLLHLIIPATSRVVLLRHLVKETLLLALILILILLLLCNFIVREAFLLTFFIKAITLILVIFSQLYIKIRIIINLYFILIIKSFFLIQIIVINRYSVFIKCKTQRLINTNNNQ